MKVQECVMRARNLNHQAIQDRKSGKISWAAELRARRDGYIYRAREILKLEQSK